ncbi:MAG: hypothetical protein ACP5KE_00940 [Candidatus Methanodesulfokora sp.]
MQERNREVCKIGNLRPDISYFILSFSIGLAEGAFLSSIVFIRAYVTQRNYRIRKMN